MDTGDINVDTGVALARMANYVTRQMDIVHWAAFKVIKGKHAEKVTLTSHYKCILQSLL